MEGFYIQAFADGGKWKSDRVRGSERTPKDRPQKVKKYQVQDESEGHQSQSRGDAAEHIQSEHHFEWQWRWQRFHDSGRGIPAKAPAKAYRFATTGSLIVDCTGLGIDWACTIHPWFRKPTKLKNPTISVRSHWKTIPTLQPLLHLTLQQVSAQRRTNAVASAHLAKRNTDYTKQTQTLRLRRSGEGLHAPTE